jgi:hypothetical protein
MARGRIATIEGVFKVGRFQNLGTKEASRALKAYKDCDENMVGNK